MMRNTETFEKIVSFIRDVHGAGDSFVPLHEPRFRGNEKRNVAECIDSTFVSSVGHFVVEFESAIRDYTGAKYAVATVNGTAALFVALRLAGVGDEDEVVTQSLTFVATSNAVKYCNAHPVYIDIDRRTLGLSPSHLKDFLKKNARVAPDGHCHNKHTGRRIAACVPVHVYGHPCDIVSLKEVCGEFNLPIVEDAAESLGSYLGGRHTGTFGLMGILSFNGNKIITCGGGGMILADDEGLARKAKHVTTTAKVDHRWLFVHDELGYNFRMTNLNAALACAQLEQIDAFLDDKRKLAGTYKKFFESLGIPFVDEPRGARSNFWLNAILLDSRDERDGFLEYTNKNRVMTRPAWDLMHTLDMFKDSYCASLENSIYIYDRLVNIPSSVRV